MLYWTLKSLTTDKLGLAAAGIGIALALILALYLDAVFRGEARQIVVFIERTPAEVWVLQDGVENLHMARSRLSDNTIAEVARVPGVASMTPVVYRELNIGDPPNERLAYVVGVPADERLRARWHERTGWPMPTGGGIVIPTSMAKELGLKIGDTIRTGEGRHRISGLSEGTFSMANPLVLMDEPLARRELNIASGASLLLVRPNPDLSAAQLASRIEGEVGDVHALPRERLLRNDYGLALQMGGALIGMLSAMATIVSALIIVFTAYSFVSARTAELAVAKALGAPQRQLLLSAVLQTCAVALIGCVLAIAAIGPLEAGLSTWVPDVAVDFSYRTAGTLSLTTIVVAAVAAVAPAFYVIKVDPALVFKG
ncbi:MAG: FtsX-like permease family protein [Alphaproteobacteria bacterium]|nr:FtsX-like permease family protein [Alphaproteobacteria bacterium]